MLKRLLQFAAVLLVLNEIRAFIMSLPVLYGMMTMVGSKLAIVVGVSYLIGLAFTVWIPIWAYRKLKTCVTPTSTIVTESGSGKRSKDAIL